MSVLLAVGSAAPLVRLSLSPPPAPSFAAAQQAHAQTQPGSARAGAATGAGGGLTSSANTAPSGHIALREVRGGGEGKWFTQCESPCSMHPQRLHVSAQPSPSLGNLGLPLFILPSPCSGVCVGHEPRQSTLPGVTLPPPHSPPAQAFVRDMSPDNPHFPASVGDLSDHLKLWRNRLQV